MLPLCRAWSHLRVCCCEARWQKAQRPIKHNNRRGKNVSKIAKTANDHAHSVSQANWAAPSSLYPSTDSLGSLGVMHRTPRADVFGSSDMLQDFFGPTDQTLSSTSTDTAIDLDNLFNSPISFSTDLSNVNIFGTADFYTAGIDSNSNSSESLPDAFPVSDKLLLSSLPMPFLALHHKIRPPPVKRCTTTKRSAQMSRPAHAWFRLSSL